MIQRVQTLYLLLAIIAIGLTFVFNLSSYEVEGGEESYSMNLYKVAEGGSEEKVAQPLYSWPMVGVLTLVELVLIATVFMYKRRKVQLKLIHFSYLLQAGAIALMFFSMDGTLQKLPLEDGMEVTTHYGVGWLMPAVSLAFSFLAARGVKKDEELVRSVDRLR